MSPAEAGFTTAAGSIATAKEFSRSFRLIGCPVKLLLQILYRLVKLLVRRF
jgi:hypothetical protein